MANRSGFSLKRKKPNLLYCWTDFCPDTWLSDYLPTGGGTPLLSVCFSNSSGCLPFSVFIRLVNNSAGVSWLTRGQLLHPAEPEQLLRSNSKLLSNWQSWCCIQWLLSLSINLPSSLYIDQAGVFACLFLCQTKQEISIFEGLKSTFCQNSCWLFLVAALATFLQSRLSSAKDVLFFRIW